MKNYKGLFLVYTKKPPYIIRNLYQTKVVRYDVHSCRRGIFD